MTDLAVMMASTGPPSSGSGLWLWVLAAGVVATGGYRLYRWLLARRKREDLDKLLARDPTLEYTVLPFGMRADQLGWWCKGLPDGDRNSGLRYAVEGPMRADLGPAMPESYPVAAFQWWWEVQRRDRTDDVRTGFRRPGFGSGSYSYSERRVPAALIQLPVHVHSRVMIEPESALGRVGLVRMGHQFESAEFNRRFRVEALEPELALALIDANFQQLLVENFPSFTIEIFGELLLVAGTPDHRDESLTGVIGLLPALRQDAHRILRAIPAAYWRAVGVVEHPR